ncbi:hypothetical protein HZH68_014106 [Vespula germanica]|uniref:Uncharacterized protein n=1 Tax=Vespula germanica TaxID=30212 RepID=A0A834JCE5_VESGE|nr:hypothetical protein HZH68_014106 [Vespula germanica]
MGKVFRSGDRKAKLMHQNVGSPDISQAVPSSRSSSVVVVVIVVVAVVVIAAVVVVIGAIVMIIKEVPRNVDTPKSTAQHFDKKTGVSMTILPRAEEGSDVLDRGVDW